MLRPRPPLRKQIDSDEAVIVTEPENLNDALALNCIPFLEHMQQNKAPAKPVHPETLGRVLFENTARIARQSRSS